MIYEINEWMNDEVVALEDFKDVGNIQGKILVGLWTLIMWKNDGSFVQNIFIWALKTMLD